jgi:RHS repeat-associated protein
VVNLIEITNGGYTLTDLERYTYDAYGTPTVRDKFYNIRTTGTAYDWQHLFTGQRQDLETGLYHYRNRQYHATLGRFVTRDPIGYDGGINLFEYVEGNPVKSTDFSGLKGWAKTCDDVLKLVKQYGDLSRHLRGKINTYRSSPNQDINHYNNIQRHCDGLKRTLDLIANCMGKRTPEAQASLDKEKPTMDKVLNQCNNDRLRPPCPDSQPAPDVPPFPIPIPPPLPKNIPPKPSPWPPWLPTLPILPIWIFPPELVGPDGSHWA